MKKRTVHLVCNAHLDPVWQWEWEEGAAEALSTFRTAADFCEEFDGFVFNHNEAVLYQWIEEYDRALFERIRRLVRQGKWHIGGSWYLQPDCHMPAGESLVRQILVGKSYFRNRFGVDNTTAYNFDSFGHSRGLVQILAKSGYDFYIHCRPTPGELVDPLPARVYRWVGYDGSSVASHQAYGWYCSDRGKAVQRVEDVLKGTAGDGLPASLALWGIGDHGGGPSREDLKLLERFRRRRTDLRLVHSTPEAFFCDILRSGRALPEYRHTLHRCFPGCYTSQARIKQQHRALENAYYVAERMVAHAWALGLMPYPKSELDAALRDLLFCEFHDILPGSSVPQVEDMALRILGRGVENCTALRARAFHALCRGQAKPKVGVVPILAVNPHAYPVTGVFECELSMPDIHWNDGFWNPVVRQSGQVLATQCEQETAHVNVEWRKRVVFRATLPPSQIARFDVTFVNQRKRPAPRLKIRDGAVRFRSPDMDLRINARTGLMDSLRFGGSELLKRPAFGIVCLQDDDDAWGTFQHSLRKQAGVFRLVSRKRATELGGTAREPVVVAEDGPVRAVVEAAFEHHDSQAFVRYVLPREGAWFDVEVTVLNAEKAKMLKLCLPVGFDGARVMCQTVYGREERHMDGSEQVAQKWVALLPASLRTHAVAVLNRGTYAFDASPGGLRLNLLRSPMYTFLPFSREARPEGNRFDARMDQGERRFAFRVILDAGGRLLDRVEREAQVYNESPFLLSFFPSGAAGRKPRPMVEVDDPAVVLTAAKRSERGNRLLVRLFEPAGKRRTASLRILGRFRKTVRLEPFEIKSLVVDPKTGAMEETDLMERPLRRDGIAAAAASRTTRCGRIQAKRGQPEDRG